MHFFEGGPIAVNLQETKELFDRHKPMFLANLIGEIRPALTGQHEEAVIQRMFSTFFGANIVYDMARQWTVRNGPFDYNYSWLTDSYTPELVKPFADGLFNSAFGAEPDYFRAPA